MGTTLKKLKEIGKQPLLTLLILLVCGSSSLAGFFLSYYPYVKIFDYEILDILMLIKGGIEADENIVLAKIDKDSEEKIRESYGPEWRKYHPKIMEQLKNAKVIAFDLYFDQQKPYDEALAKSMRESKNVVIGTTKNAKIPEVILSSSKPGYIDFKTGLLFKKAGRLEPIRLKEEKQPSTEYPPHYFEASFLFRMLQLYFDISYPESDNGRKIYAIEEDGNILKIGLARKIPRDNLGMMYVRNIARKESFTEISYHDLYNGKFNQSQINEKTIVIIGLTGKHVDIHWTPYGRKYGLMLNALALNTVLKEGYIYQSSGWLYFTMLLACSLVFSISILSVGKKYTTIALILIFLLIIAATFACFWVQAMPLIISLFITYLLTRQLTKKLTKKITPNKPLMTTIFVVSSGFFVWYIGYCISISDPDPLLNIILAYGAAVVFFLLAEVFSWLQKKRKEEEAINEP